MWGLPPCSLFLSSHLLDTGIVDDTGIVFLLLVPLCLFPSACSLVPFVCFRLHVPVCWPPVIDAEAADVKSLSRGAGEQIKQVVITRKYKFKVQSRVSCTKKYTFSKALFSKWCTIDLNLHL